MIRNIVTFCIILAAVTAGFLLGASVESRRIETKLTESRDRSMRTNYCTQICKVQEQSMLGVTEKPEWRCFCADGYWQPLP